MKFLYIVEFIKRFIVPKFHQISFSDLISIVDKKIPWYRTYGVILHNTPISYKQENKKIILQNRVFSNHLMIEKYI